MMKRLMVGLVAAGLLFAVAAPAGAQDLSGSIRGSLTTTSGNTDPLNNATVSVNASGDPTDSRGTYQRKGTYRDAAGAIVNFIQRGRVTCFARIGNRAYVEFQVTKVIGGSAGGAQVGDYLVEAWEDNRATGEPDRHTLLSYGAPGAGYCDEPSYIAMLDEDLDIPVPPLVPKGNITIR